MPVYYMDYVNGNDSTTTTPLGWWSVSVTSPAGTKPVAGETMTGVTSAKTAVLTVTPATWTGTVVLYFYGRSGAFQAENVTFTGGGTGTIGADLTYCAWKTVTSGALAARTAPGDTIRIANSDAPTIVTDEASNNLKFAWTDGSAAITIRNNADDGNETATLNVDLCEATGTGNNQWPTAPATNVTVATDTTYVHQGSNCIAISVASAFTTGLAAFAKIASTSFASYQQISFWIRSNTAVAANSLRIDLCSGADGTGAVDSFTINHKLEANANYPLTINKGSALGEAIQSVAVTVLIDLSASATVILYIDNIFAHNGLSLVSLIGKNSAGETWWAIKNIDSSTSVITLGSSVHYTTNSSNYSGSSETVVAYKREPIKLDLVTSASANHFATNEGGTYGSDITYSGGWSTATNEQTDVTWFDGTMQWGWIFNIPYNSTTITNIGGVRTYGFYNAGCFNTFTNCYATNGSRGFYLSNGIGPVTFTSCIAVQTISIGGFTIIGGTPYTIMSSCKSFSSLNSSNVAGIYLSCGMLKCYNCTVKGNNQYDFYITGGILYSYNMAFNTSPTYCTTGGGWHRSDAENASATTNKTRIFYGLNTSVTTAYNTLQADTVIYRTASPSLRMIPNHATYKAESAPPDEGMKVPVASGNTVTVHVWVRKSSVSDSGGVNYAGNQPRLIVRRNDIVGYTADTVLATATGSDLGTWQELTGTTSAAAASGVYEFIVDADGTSAAWINTDDWHTA